MSKFRFVPTQELPAFLEFLSQKGRVLAPAEKPADRQSVVFEPWTPGKAFTLAKATVAPRRAVLPESEVLLSYRQASPEAPIELECVIEAEPTFVFGSRFCDARGFVVFDRPYLHGPYADPYYKARREGLCVLTLTCDSGCNTCFCHWVGGGPTSPEGSDVLMTGVDGGLVLQAISKAGEALLEDSPLADGQQKFAEAEEVRKKAWASLKPAPDISDAPKSLAAIFSDEQFWTDVTAKCISCGACTYFCPTCYCFNITDEGTPQEPSGGRRLRSWDNCMSSLFTREASGHNPRARKAQRMRNRVSHKFCTYPENWGAFSCSGCGRCIANCPVKLDIRAIVLSGIQTAAR